mgnify:CR=1 FL=1
MAGTGEQWVIIRNAKGSGLASLLADRKIVIDLKPAAREWLAEKGYDPAYGARPLKRVIQKHVQDALAELILSGAVKDGDNVPVDAGPLGLVIGDRASLGTAVHLENAKVVRSDAEGLALTWASTDPKVDPVGACVGARGARVKTIVRELGGEKIDIIKFFADPREMVIEALKPAVPREIIIDDKAHRVVLKVATDDLAIAIGRKGQNARLTSRLIGWRLDIEEFKAVGADPEGDAKRKLVATLGIPEATALRLVKSGFVSLELFEGVEAGDLEGAGFTAEEAADIIARVTARSGQ